MERLTLSILKERIRGDLLKTACLCPRLCLTNKVGSDAVATQVVIDPDPFQIGDRRRRTSLRILAGTYLSESSEPTVRSIEDKYDELRFGLSRSHLEVRVL